MMKINAHQLKQFMNTVTPTAKIVNHHRSTGIIGAFYLRIYLDGSILNLGSDANWFKYWLDQIQIGAYQSNNLVNQYFPHPGINLWELNFDNPVWQDAKRHFNFGNGITFCYESAGFKEVLCFYSTAANRAINHFYINYPETLKKMREDFLFQASPLIQAAEKERLISPLIIFPQTSTKMNTYNAIFDAQLVKTKGTLSQEKDANSIGEKNKFHSSFDKVFIIHKNTHLPIHLSAQRQQCLVHLSQGKSVKEIARAMNLTSKTIEHYLELLRKELGCRSSKELIASYGEQLFNRGISPY